jgi:hypothetical protein
VIEASLILRSRPRIAKYSPSPFPRLRPIVGRWNNKIIVGVNALYYFLTGRVRSWGLGEHPASFSCIVGAPVHTDEGGLEESSAQGGHIVGFSVVIRCAGEVLRWGCDQRRGQGEVQAGEWDVDSYYLRD